MKTIKVFLATILFFTGLAKLSAQSSACEITKTNGGGFTTIIESVI